MFRRAFLTLPEAERRIEWFLAHPNFSDWLKESLRNALDRDPVDVANDLELLTFLLHPWANARIDEVLVISEKTPNEYLKGKCSLD